MARKEDFADLKVGDGIWCTDPKWRQSDPDKPLMEIVVTKVGRKYVTCHRREDEGCRYSGFTFEIDGGREKGDSNYKRELVRSPYQYERDLSRDRTWDKFKRAVHNTYGQCDAELEDIIRAADLLNIKLDL